MMPANRVTTRQTPSTGLRQAPESNVRCVQNTHSKHWFTTGAGKQCSECALQDSVHRSQVFRGRDMPESQSRIRGIEPTLLTATNATYVTSRPNRLSRLSPTQSRVCNVPFAVWRDEGCRTPEIDLRVSHSPWISN